MSDQVQNQKLIFRDFKKQTLGLGQDVDVLATLATIESYKAIPGYLTPTVTELLVAPKDKVPELLQKLFLGLSEPEGAIIPPEAENLPQFRATSTQLEASLPTGSPSPLREKAYKDTQTVLRGREKWVREVVQKFNDETTRRQIYGTSLTEDAPAEIKKQFTTSDQTPESIVEAIPFIKRAAQDQTTSFITNDPVAAAVVETVLTTPLTDIPPFINAFTSSEQISVQIKKEHPQILETARRVAVAQVVVSAPSIETHTLRLGGFSKEPLSAAASIIGSALPSASEIVAEGAFEKFWAKTGASEKFVEKLTTALGSGLNQSVFDGMIRSGNNRMSQKSMSQSFLGGLFDTVTSVVAGVPEEQAIDYFKALHEKALKNKAFSPQPKPEHVVAMSHLNSHPDGFLIIGAATTNWTLLLKPTTAPSGLGAAAVGVVAAGTTQKATSGLISKVLGAFGFAGGGPVGGAITTFLTDVVLTKMLAFGGQVLSGLGYLASGGWMTGEGVPLEGFVMWLPWVIVGSIALLFVFPSFLNFSTLSDDLRHATLAINLQGNGGGGDGPGVGSAGGVPAPAVSMAPANYTGPQPTNTLQCLNYNVSSGAYGYPLSPQNATRLNTAIDQYKQIGLYNCLLQCPQQKINIYGNNNGDKLYGLAPGDASKGNIVFYDYLFSPEGAGNNLHATARIVAHEFAHELSYFHPDAMSAFMNGTAGPDGIINSAIQKGYCGHPLCTYPSGNYGTCNASETTDETFAEAAAMYLTGEDLNALCPASYAFMSQMFGQCASK